MKVDKRRIRASANPSAQEVLLLVKKLEGVQLGTLGQSLGHAKCAVATEGAQLDHVHGTNHAYQHLEHTPLQMTAGHLTIGCAELGVSPQGVQVIALSVNVAQDVVVCAHSCSAALSISASMAKR